MFDTIALVIMYSFLGFIGILFFTKVLITILRIIGLNETANILAKKFNVATEFLRP